MTQCTRISTFRDPFLYQTSKTLVLRDKLHQKANAIKFCRSKDPPKEIHLAVSFVSEPVAVMLRAYQVGTSALLTGIHKLHFYLFIFFKHVYMTMAACLLVRGLSDRGSSRDTWEAGTPAANKRCM